MSFFEIFVIGVSLAMDAFAVSICKGLGMKKIDYRKMFIIAGLFGAFQAIMPLIGWLLGSQFEKYIVKFDHWIAFVLLAFIGGKMIFDVLRGGDDDCADCGKFDIKELFVMAIATSIDALATGIVFGLQPELNIWVSIAIIGITTFLICVGGVFIGNRFGVKFKDKAAFAGGVILIIIGLKILLEHLGVINF